MNALVFTVARGRCYDRSMGRQLREHRGRTTKSGFWIQVRFPSYRTSGTKRLSSFEHLLNEKGLQGTKKGKNYAKKNMELRRG